ncbi:hypothetical protein HPP92_011995 [Vanilla planifolia]|uniref:Uncharacterized protein n=1 Tax=Vanilla planifolia TaxID=51239 RepID=A0A835R857_VANPL|nr:hypothetical protein HPP92_011995 [Vanilla planifolia]
MERCTTNLNPQQIQLTINKVKENNSFTHSDLKTQDYLKEFFIPWRIKSIYGQRIFEEDDRVDKVIPKAWRTDSFEDAKKLIGWMSFWCRMVLWEAVAWKIISTRFKV